jgi:hypothetical protein
MPIADVTLKKSDPEVTVDDIHSTLPAILSGLVDLLVEKKVISIDDLRKKIEEGLKGA